MSCRLIHSLRLPNEQGNDADNAGLLCARRWYGTASIPLLAASPRRCTDTHLGETSRAGDGVELRDESLMIWGSRIGGVRNWDNGALKVNRTIEPHHMLHGRLRIGDEQAGLGIVRGWVCFVKRMELYRPLFAPHTFCYTARLIEYELLQFILAE